jgi:hypothetical protein
MSTAGPLDETATRRADDAQCPEEHHDAGGEADRGLAEPIDDREEHDRQSEDENGGGETAH